MNALQAILAEGLREGLFPGAAAVVLGKGGVISEAYAGRGRIWPDERPASPGTLWDIASLTKPLAGAGLCLLGSEDGQPSLDDPLSRFDNLYHRTAFDGITVRRLLLHLSGLPAWFPCYVRGEGRRAYRRTLSALDLESRPGERAVYSCLGFLLLADVLETASASPIDVLFRDRLARPLGLEKDLLFSPAVEDVERSAGGERDDSTERRMVSARGLAWDGFRRGFVNGEVNDGNAFRRGNGVSLNAGLFGTARAVARAGWAWLDQDGPFPRRLVEEAVLRGTPEGGASRGLGWQLESAPAAGAALSPRSFGHTGFTGSSLFCDPVCERVCVLLTNRLHAETPPADLNPFRRRFHEVAVSL